MASVYFYADDPAFAVSVVVHRSASSDADHARYVDRFQDFDARSREHKAPVFILLAEAGSEPPDAKWRKRIADASRNVNENSLVVFVSESTLIRGIVTAINWIRPPHYATTVVGSIHEAIEWVEKRRPGVRMIVQRLYVEARTAADREFQKSSGTVRAGGT